MSIITILLNITLSYKNVSSFYCYVLVWFVLKQTQPPIYGLYDNCVF